MQKSKDVEIKLQSKPERTIFFLKSQKRAALLLAEVYFFLPVPKSFLPYECGSKNSDFNNASMMNGVTGLRLEFFI